MTYHTQVKQGQFLGKKTSGEPQLHFPSQLLPGCVVHNYHRCETAGSKASVELGKALGLGQ